MKKTLLLLFLIVSTKSVAQWNFSGGITLTDYNVKDSFTKDKLDNFQKTGTGFYVKISHTLYANKVIFIEPGFGFNTTNTEEKESFGIKSSNIILPVELGAKVGNHFKLVTGFQGNFLLTAKTIKTNQEIEFRSSPKNSFVDFLVGFDVTTPRDKFHLTFRYNGSLKSVLEDRASSYNYLKGVYMIGLKYSLKQNKAGTETTN